MGWNKSCTDVPRSVAHCTGEHLYRIYSIPTHDKHQWLLLQFIVLLMMDAKGVRNMQSILVVVNKHNTARVVSCWFIIYYRHVLHGNSNIKRKYSSTLFMTSALEGGEWSANAPAAPYPPERPGTHCTGGWVGLRTGLELIPINFTQNFTRLTVLVL